MGLLWAILITAIVSFFVFQVWRHPKNPLPEDRKKELEIYIILILFFILLSL